jgi:hypothetical protein
MLPEIKASFTGGFSGQQLADHYGEKRSDGTPDNPGSPDD